MEHEKLDYVEFAAQNLDATKAFFSEVFGWTFTDYGPEYTAFDFRTKVTGYASTTTLAQTDSTVNDSGFRGCFT